MEYQRLFNVKKTGLLRLKSELIAHNPHAFYQASKRQVDFDLKNKN
jgi:hypothetical protein